MFSKLELEGYLEIDHRESPGFTEKQAREARWGKTMPVGSKRFKLVTYRCCGCEAMIVVRSERTRERTWCRKCDRFMCDQCSWVLKVTGVHKPMNQIIDDFVKETANLPRCEAV